MPLVLDGDTGIVGVLLTDANGNVTFDTNTLYVDAPNNRVGIGTTSPGATLDVAGGNIRMDAGWNLEWGNGYTSGNPAIWAGTSSDLSKLRFAPTGNNGGIVMEITDSTTYITSNVGIGTTVPDGKLTVALENSNTPAFRLSSPTSGTDFAISSYNDANGTYVSMGVNHLFNVSGNDAVMDTNDKSAAIVLDGRNNGRIQFLTNSSGTATPRMTILQDGKVGINNTTPPVKLSVGKTITAYEDSIAITGINSNADIMAGIGFDQSIDTLIIRNDQSFPAGGIAFRPANGTTTKMFIRQDGYVSIGGTHAPVETLDLRFSGRHGIICGSTSGSGSYIVLDGAGNGDAAGSDYAYIEHTSSGNLNFNVGNGSNSTNTKMLIEPGGNVGVGLSDPSYKLDVGGIGATQLRLKSSGDTGYTQGAMIIESSASSSNPGNRGQGVYYYNVPNLRTWYTGTLYNNGNKFGFGYKQASGLQVSAADNANAIMILDGDNSLLELKKTNGTLSGGANRSGATIKLHHEAQWESGYSNNPSASTNDYLGGIEFSTGDNSTGEGVRAAIRATVDSYYNQNSIVFETVSGATAADPIERMRVLHNGNVGIGTSNPTSKLHVHGDTSNTFSALMLRNRGQVAGSAVKAIWSLNRDGSDVDFEAGSITVGKQQNWTTTPSTVDSYMAFSLTGNESIFETMRLDSDGGARLNSTSQVRFTLGNEGTPGTNTANWIRGSGGQLGLNAAHDNIHFEIGGSPKMLLNSSGLQLPGNYQYNAVDGFAFYYPSGRMQLGFNYNAFGAEIILGNNRTASGETAFMQYRTNGVTEGTLVGNGSGFSITNVSDYRKKENINELPNGSLARVVNVRPVTYTLKEEYTNDTSKIYTGFIAHEFQEQFPNSVRGVKDELNEDGTPKLQSIDITSNELLTHLIKSIQELKTENDALKARLDSAGL